METSRTIRFIPAQREPELDWFTEGAACALGEDSEMRASYHYTLKVIQEEILPNGEVVVQELTIYEPTVYLPLHTDAAQEGARFGMGSERSSEPAGT